jgi:hypothetical protein
MPAKKKVITIGTAFAGALTLAGASVYLLRRVHRRGVNARLFEEGPTSNVIFVTQRTLSHDLWALTIFDDIVGRDSKRVAEIEDRKNELYAAVVSGKAETCSRALTALFRVLCPANSFRDFAPAEISLKFRDDLRDIINTFVGQPIRAARILDRWQLWWTHGEHFLPPEEMWLSLPVVAVGLAYFEKYQPRLTRRQNRDQDTVLVLMQRVADLIDDQDCGSRLAVLTELSEYLLTHGYQAA